jgi:DNA modification methylase
MAIRKIADLTPQRRNANRHTQYGMARLEDSIRADGYLTPMTAAASGEVFDGSARLETVADLMGDTEPIVVESDGTRPIVHIRTDIPTADDPRAVRLALAANRVAELNLEWDAEVLAELADEGATEGLFTAEDLAALAVETETTEGAGGDEFDATPEDGPTRCQPGDLWQLGRHRLLCGDSTDPLALERLMGGDAAAMVWADPPYGMSFQSSHRYASPQFDVIAGDQRPLTEFIPLIIDVPVWYVCCRWDSAPTFMEAVRAAGFKVVNWIVWHKSRGGMGDLEAGYRPTHETILYCSRERAFFAVDGRDDDTWDEQADAPSAYEHPTQKPVGLPARAIRNHSRPGDVILDPFGGSGPSLVACERLQRACRMLELDPRYCDVILRRWEAETGQTAERIDAATPMHAGNPHA